VSLHFLRFAIFFANTDVLERGTPQSSASEVHDDRNKFAPLIRVHENVFAAWLIVRLVYRAASIILRMLRYNSGGNHANALGELSFYAPIHLCPDTKFVGQQAAGRHPLAFNR
jgi:hypothetical protein